MATPSEKSPEMEKLITAIFGVDRQEKILANECVRCECSAGEFRDSVSKEEFKISGLCQDCQDHLFQ